MKTTTDNEYLPPVEPGDGTNPPPIETSGTVKNPLATQPIFSPNPAEVGGPVGGENIELPVDKE